MNHTQEISILERYLHFIPDKDIAQYIEYRKIWTEKRLDVQRVTIPNLRCTPEELNALNKQVEKAYYNLTSLAPFWVCSYLNIEDLQALLDFRTNKPNNYKFPGIHFTVIPMLARMSKYVLKSYYQT